LNYHGIEHFSPITMDVNDLASSPHGAQFVPDLPPPGAEPEGIDPFPDPIEDDYVHYLERSTNRSVLTGQRRSEMRDILGNPEMSIDVGDSNENARLRNLKVWTLKYFELDENQLNDSYLLGRFQQPPP